MDKQTIEIVVPAMGNPITIILKDPWAGMDTENVTYHESRDTPICDACHCDLEETEFDEDDEDVWQEKWICPNCEDVYYFVYGEYGEDEVTVSNKTWEAMCVRENQDALLIKRYGTPYPKSIRDYWQ